MEYIVLLILDDPGRLDEVLSAWSKGGIAGATIVESTGLFRHQRKKMAIPMRYMLPNSHAEEKDNMTIFALVDDKATAEKCLKLAESVVGDLDGPNTGVFAAWPIDIVKGLSHRQYPEGE